MNDLLFVIWKMTQMWDEEAVIAADIYCSKVMAPHEQARVFETTGKSQAGKQIRELLTAAGYQHEEG